MNLNSNLKDTISTYAGILGAIGLAIVALPSQGIVLPSWLLGLGGIFTVVSVTVIGILTGKAPNGTSKTPEQIVSGNVVAPLTTTAVVAPVQPVAQVASVAPVVNIVPK